MISNNIIKLLSELFKPLINFTEGLFALIVGHLEVLSYCFQKSATIEYPNEKRELSDNYRGRIVQKQDENGNYYCTACGQCQRVCPTKATIEIIKNEGKATYTRNNANCIYCGNCVEYCPFKALEYKKEFEMPKENKNDLIDKYEVK